MQQPTFDPGLTQQYAGNLKRTINKDGAFNVRQRGSTWRDVHLFLFLVSVPWRVFFLLVLATYILANTFFAAMYMAAGVEHLQGADTSTVTARFLSAFFFSAQTVTTVGYGNLHPEGNFTNLVAAFEALVGLLGFAIATGLLFGRFSRPSARIGFSERMIVAPYQDGLSLQLRVVNRRSNILIELEASLTLMTVEFIGDRLQRRFAPLTLERSRVLFLPLTWTIVHPIDQSSPLFGKTREDLERLQAEVLVFMKGFDDTFSQTVHARYSYRYDEVVWGAKFAPAFEIEPEGDLLVEINKVSDIERVSLRT